MSAGLAMLIAGGGLLFGCFWLMVSLRRQRRLIRDVAESHRAVALRAAEIVHIKKRRKQAATTARTARDAVSISTTATQSVHKGISGLVFDVLDVFPAVRESSRVVKTVHDTTADSIYDVIRLVDRIEFEDRSTTDQT